MSEIFYPTQEIETKIVKETVRQLLAAGWELTAFNDGEEDEPCTDVEEAIDAVFSVDDAYLFFHKTHWVHAEDVGSTHWVRFVLGNGVDVIADHTLPRTANLEWDDFDRVMEAVGDWVEELQ